MSERRRPNPDELLARVRVDETRQAQGRLKIFFGAAPGVGKTYAMLEAARARRAEGVDVSVGVVETHGRAETEALLIGLEVLPRRELSYRGRRLAEFDLDGAIDRRPRLIVVDELAHTNAPGSRHEKRHSDVQELLARGVDVYTTLNVQHLESLNDVVAQITGVAVRETVPDAIFDEADEIELVDLPAEDLLRRLAEGRVYIPSEATRAADHFFREGNLIALRQLALRRAAERVDAQMLRYRASQAVSSTWPAAERLLVCVAPSPYAARLVRTTKRMATATHSEWIAVSVETLDSSKIAPADRDQLERALRLAEQLGGEAVTLVGTDPAEEIVAYARRRNVTRIVVGQPLGGANSGIFRRSLVERLIRSAGGIDVVVVSGVAAHPGGASTRPSTARADAAAYFLAVAATAAITVAARLMSPWLAPPNLIAVYLLIVALVALRGGRGPGVLASVLSVAAFDFFFVPPSLTFAVADSQYLVTFAVMLAVALVISDLTARLRAQIDLSRARERRTAALYAVSRASLGAESYELARLSARHIAEALDASVITFLPHSDGRLGVVRDPTSGFVPDERERAVAAWVHANGEPAGLGTSTLPAARALHLPLVTSRGVVGVLAVRPAGEIESFTTDQLHLLEAFASQIALAVERAKLAAEAQAAELLAQAEKTRSLILSSVSHDLRTPLTAISGAAETLELRGEHLDPEVRSELAHTIHASARRLTRFVSDLLDFTRLTSGKIVIRREPQAVEELVGAALDQLGSALGDVRVAVSIPDGLPMPEGDAALLTQVLVNLLENASVHAPSATSIEISVVRRDESLEVSVADRGPGVPRGDEERIFDEFYRRSEVAKHPGAGLGLAICRAIVEAHGGDIRARNREEGGCEVTIRLPLGPLKARKLAPPAVPTV
ncbi:MAG: sensor histidine kinase KdpD [Acidobacteriota bacterium]